MPHGDPIIHRDGVEFFSNTASSFNLLGNQFAEIAQMHVPWYKLGKGVHNGDDRFAEIGIGHPGCAPQRAGARHIAAMCGGGGTVLRHALFTPISVYAMGRCVPSHF